MGLGLFMGPARSHLLNNAQKLPLDPERSKEALGTLHEVMSFAKRPN